MVRRGLQVVSAAALDRHTGAGTMSTVDVNVHCRSRYCMVMEHDMIRLAGHTMGTPGKTLFEAMTLFKRLGLDGIEIRVAPDGQLDPDSYSADQGRDIVAHAGEIGIGICCLTSYYSDFVSPDKRDAQIAGLRHVVDIAAEVGCPLVRAMGGACGTAEQRPEVIRGRTIDGLRHVADHAAPRGVRLAIETHIGYLCLTARYTAGFVREVDRENVGILFDYAWVHYAGEESAREAVEAVSPYLFHCHVKDWTYEGGDRNQRRSALMGQGDVDWPEVLHALEQTGYTGYLSDEYEKHWYPELLPEPEQGMGHNAAYLRRALQD